MAGPSKRKPYFEGWYFKQQNDRETLAFIPAYHTDERGETTASLQIVTGEGVYYVDFPAQSLKMRAGLIELGGNVFSKAGVRLECESDGLSLKGTLSYGPLTPAAYDIMGPYRLVPGMQCVHSVISLSHQVSGSVRVNGREYAFNGGLGYIEGDRGVSFPRGYLWTQCSFGGNCIMLSIARIPFLGMSFTGCVCAALIGDTEYRMATYNGVEILNVDRRGAHIRLDELSLEAELLSGEPQALRAPERGSMSRTIEERAQSRVHYRLTRGERVLCDFVSGLAGYEYCPKEDGL